MRIIDSDKLKAHYAWWANGDRDAQDNKRIFDSIVDVQPTLYFKPCGTELEEKLPSTQKTGRTWRWIKKTDADGVYYCCSYCAEKLYRTVSKTRYCPNCGAKMEVEHDG